MKNNNIIKIALLGALVITIPTDICATTWSEWLWSFVPTQWASNLTTKQKVGLAVGTAAVCTGLACLYKKRAQKNPEEKELKEESQLQEIFQKYGYPVLIVQNKSNDTIRNVSVGFRDGLSKERNIQNGEMILFFKNIQAEDFIYKKIGKIHILKYKDLPLYLYKKYTIVNYKDERNDLLFNSPINSYVIHITFNKNAVIKKEIHDQAMINSTLKEILKKHGYNPDNILPQ